MTRSAREAALIERLEREIETSPGRYKFKLACLALAGYAVLIGMLALSLGLPLWMLASIATGRADFDTSVVYGIGLPACFAAILLRALWTPFGAPSGYRLTPGEAPALEAEVERIRTAMGAPPLHGIVIDDALNAAAVDMPRVAGLLGHRHYLVLGLPLLRLFDPDEAAFVIAHEFGHFGAGHGRFAGWIYRIRVSWHRALHGMARSGFALGYLLAKGYGWYVPYFDAYSFVLARRHEFEADAAAAAATRADIAASALIRLELASRRAQRTFHGELDASARTQSYPPAQMHAALAQSLGRARGCDVPRLLEIAARDSEDHDTHPILPRRLAALDAAPALRAPAPDDAATAWLGARLPEIERRLDEAWRERMRASWQQRHTEAARDRARLAELESRASPSPDELLEQARLSERLYPDRDAEPRYARLIEANPDSAFAHYRRGYLRLRRGAQTEGLADLRAAMARDPGAIRPILADLKVLRDDPDLDAPTAAAIAELDAECAPQAQALDARETVAAEDALLAHALDAAALARLRTALARESRVAAAWLARKPVPFAESQPHFVLLLDWRGSVVGEIAGLRQLSSAIDLPGSHTVFTGSDRRDLARRVKRACGEPVYRKGAT